MPRPTNAGRRWICRPGRPTSVVLFGVAAILAVLTAIAVVDVFISPLPPVQYGPFGDPHALTGAILLMVIFVGVGSWAVRGLSTRALSRALLLLIAAGPIGWGMALLDALGPDWFNSAGDASPFLAMVLLVVAPIVTVGGIVAAVAEIVRSSVGAFDEAS